MDRKRWKTNRSRRIGYGKSRWWIGFTVGLLFVIIVKVGVLLSEGSHNYSKQSTDELIESSLLVQEREASSDQRAEGTAQEPLPSKSRTDESKSAFLGDYDRMWVRVYLVEDKRIEKMPIELYVRGVIAGEMPIDFELEALKAQAIAARTYIYQRLLTKNRSDMPAAGQEADVMDTVQNQVYVPLSKLLNRWSGEEKETNLKKLNQAVEQTKGQIVTYKGEPIQAAFFSTSNGYTENASDYWSIDVPYLKSVISPWDKFISPRYKETVTMKLSEFSDKLGVKKNEIQNMRVVGTTEGNTSKDGSDREIKIQWTNNEREARTCILSIYLGHTG